jgi:hypothetical protein
MSLDRRTSRLDSNDFDSIGQMQFILNQPLNAEVILNR